VVGRRLSRRDLFRRAAPETLEHVNVKLREELDIPLPARRRPPGAVPEAEFLSLCTRCGDCVAACPHKAIHTLTAQAGLGADTPVMVPDSRACHMCEGFPCATACPEGALVTPSTRVVKLGTVTLDESTCLPFSGPECGACADWCPGGVRALTLKLGRPRVDGAACVGCGLCIVACPVEPAALRLEPLSESDSCTGTND